MAQPTLDQAQPSGAPPWDEAEGGRSINLQGSDDWYRLVTALRINGLALELARHCGLDGWDGERLRLQLDPSHLHLRTPGAEQRLAAALAAVLDCDLRLEIAADGAVDQTPALRRAQEEAQRLAAAEEALRVDPVAQQLCERFDAEWIAGTLSAPRKEAGAEWR
jgi:DNA polymerase-3 subunit gamma/tau